MTCIHRGDLWHHFRSTLCGSRGNLEPVYRCRLHVLCTHRKYKHGQPERCCLACDDFQPCETKEAEHVTQESAPD